MNTKKEKWEESYECRENFVFYPHEEVIRFISKYIRKRVGINEYRDIIKAKKALDLGCGIGRHVLYLDEIGFDAYGVDLSEKAINYAKEWCREKNNMILQNKLIASNIVNMPFENEEFDFIVSHGVLDSMEFTIAKQAVKEAYRVTKEGGLFYLDLIAGDGINQPLEYDKEVLLERKHEKGTIQSYFNLSKINKLINRYFEIVEINLVNKQSLLNVYARRRYHIVLRRL